MLINFTGIDGSGKTSQIDLLYKHLVSLGRKIQVVKAFGKNEKVLFQEYMEHADQKTILFLFQALHVEQCIQAKVALNNHKIVISDRWDESFIPTTHHLEF